MASEADADGFVHPDKKHTANPEPEQTKKWKSTNQFAALRSDRQLDDTESAADQRASNLTSSALSSSQASAISHLLKICAENNVSINEHLRQAILGKELYDEATCGCVSRKSLSERESLLGSLIASNLTDREDELGATAHAIRDQMDLMENKNISVEARVKDGKYAVTVPAASKGGGIPTVGNTGAVAKLTKRMGELLQGKERQAKEETKVIMEGVNLCLEEGKMYLILGAPGEWFTCQELALCYIYGILLTCDVHILRNFNLIGCGKSTLLKMIANLLPTSSKAKLSGSVTVNGVDSNDPSLIWSNIVSYVDQIDRLHGYLTVKETLEFAFDCRLAGTHYTARTKENDEDVKKLVKEMDEQGWLVNGVLGAIGLARVKDTFVGNDKVRGVSGGQRKRVTVGEMMCVSSQIQMLDEISTGLDGKFYRSLNYPIRLLCSSSNSKCCHFFSINDL